MVNQNHKLNHHVGMSMEVPFVIPESRKDAKGQDIKFTFSGDDDLWVFLEWEEDGVKKSKLVLDIGGIHQPVAGSIDFTHGKSYYNDGTVDDWGQPPVGDYTLKVFYIERGGCDSNLSIQFNLPLRDVGDVIFKKVDAENNATVLPGAVFGLYSDESCASDKLVMQATSGDNGIVKFEDVTKGTYYLKEITPPDGYLASDEVYRVTVGSENEGEPTTIEGLGNSGESTLMENTPEKLSVKKVWQPARASGAEPQEIYFKLYKRVQDGEDQEIIVCPGHEYVNGKGYKLDDSNNWATTFDKLGAGEYYVVESDVPEGYAVTYVQGDEVDDTNQKEQADEASAGSAGALTMVNRLTSMNGKVEKTWEGINQNDESLKDVKINVKIGRYKLVDKLGALTIKTPVTLSGESAEQYPFGATYQVLDASGKVVREFTYDGADHTFENLPVGDYTVTETLSQPDPALGYEITHDPTFDAGSLTHSQSVKVEKDKTKDVTFTSSYRPKKGTLTITKTVNNPPSGFTFNGTYTVKLGDQTVGTYTYGQLPQTLTLPEGDYTVIESNVPADPSGSRGEHSTQTLTNIQVREGSPQTAAFTSTYTSGMKVSVKVIHFQNDDNPTNVYEAVNTSFIAGQTIVIRWYQTVSQSAYTDLYVNGTWKKNWNTAGYHEYEYTIPPNSSGETIKIKDPWYSGGIDNSTITVRLKDSSNGTNALFATARDDGAFVQPLLRAPQKKTVTVRRSANAPAPEVPEALKATKMYVIDNEFDEIEVELTQSGEWKKDINDLEPVDENGEKYWYFISEVVETELDFEPEVTIDENILISLDNNKTATMKLNNKLTKGSLELTKVVTVNGQQETTALSDGTYLTDGTYTFEVKGVEDTATAEEPEHTVSITFKDGKALNYTIDGGEAQSATGDTNRCSVVLSGLTPGDYTVEETTFGKLSLKLVTGGKENLTEGKTNPITVTVTGGDTTPNDSRAKATFTNNIGKVDLSVVKVNSDTQQPIDGATFKLTRVDENGDPVAGGYMKEQSVEANGKLTFEGVTTGRYRLDETVVPEGYIKLEGPYYINVDDEGNSDLDTGVDNSIPHELIEEKNDDEYTVGNTPGPKLPSTGGPGTTILYATGITLIALAACLLLRKKEQDIL